MNAITSLYLSAVAVMPIVVGVFIHAMFGSSWAAFASGYVENLGRQV